MKAVVIVWILSAVVVLGQGARPLSVVSTVADLAARSGNGTESVLVLDGGTFADSTGFAVLFVRSTNSVAATNLTDTVAALPSGRWIARRISGEPTPFLHADDRIASWFRSSSYWVTNATLNSSGTITNAGIRWPDGSAGSYVVTSIDSTFLAPNAWYFTHAISGKTFTQPSVIRDSTTGVITSFPALTVSPPGDTFTYPYTNYIGGVGWYADLNAFRAATNNFTVVLIGSDTNGIPGTWVRGAGSGTNDGYNFWSDAAGVQIKRIL